MNGIEVWAAHNPGLLVGSASSLAVCGEILPPTGSIAVARLDGRELADADIFFWRISDAFKFPSYFGWNWDALYDCLRDLSWYQADYYLLIFDYAERIMVESPEERKTFFSVLKRATVRWSDPVYASDENGASFKVIFLCAEDEVDNLRAEIAK